MPWQVVLAGALNALLAVPLLFLTALGWAHRGDLAGGPWPAPVLTVVTVGQLAGAFLLSTGRSWRVLVGSSLAVSVAVPVALVATATGEGRVAADLVGPALLPLGSLLTALLASSPGARAWAAAPSRLPADRQQALGQGP